MPRATDRCFCDGLPGIHDIYDHYTPNADNAAGLRGLKAKLEQLNDDGTPAEPTQEDGPTHLSAEQGTTPEAKPSAVEVADLGYAIGKNVSAAGSRRVLPNYMQQAEVGNAYMLALQAELEDLERSDPAIAKAAQNLQEALERAAQNIHQIYVSRNAMNCTISCSGPLPHIHEYRAADVRPSTEQTARNNAQS